MSQQFLEPHGSGMENKIEFAVLFGCRLNMLKPFTLSGLKISTEDFDGFGWSDIILTDERQQFLHFFYHFSIGS